VTYNSFSSSGDIGHGIGLMKGSITEAVRKCKKEKGHSVSQAAL
jgi:hypothetical protein